MPAKAILSPVGKKLVRNSIYQKYIINLKQKQTEMNKKGALLLAGAAAYAYYRYSKMTPEEKANIKNKVNEYAGKVMDNIPDEVKNVFSKVGKQANEWKNEVEKPTS